jgi:hypothetical protein
MAMRKDYLDLIFIYYVVNNTSLEDHNGNMSGRNKHSTTDQRTKLLAYMNMKLKGETKYVYM